MAALARADSCGGDGFFRLVRASRLVSSRCRAAWFWSRRFLRSACSAVRACWAAGSGRLAVSPACSARVWAALWAAASSLEKASRLLAAASSAACRVRRCFWVSARAAAIAAASGQGRFFLPLGKAGLGFRGGFFGVGLCGAGLLHSVCLVGALGLQAGLFGGSAFPDLFCGIQHLPCGHALRQGRGAGCHAGPAGRFAARPGSGHRPAARYNAGGGAPERRRYAHTGYPAGVLGCGFRLPRLRWRLWKLPPQRSPLPAQLCCRRLR